MRIKEIIRNKKGMQKFLLPAALVLGLFLLIYPSAADYWNSMHQARSVRQYVDQVSKMSQEDYEYYLTQAKEYNLRLSKRGISWDPETAVPEDYERQLSFNSSGNMGYIDIPKIGVQLPIYHGVSDEVLQTSIGHMKETSLPVGGKGSHCVLSGHRGLPSARLFSDLDKLQEGDTFTLSVLYETFTYEVDRIRVVEPTDLTELKIYPKEDLCTLVTCTPYGVNTHRLLVRGHRVQNANGDALVVADALQLEPAFVAPFIMIPMIFLLLFLLLVSTARSGKEKGKRYDR